MKNIKVKIITLLIFLAILPNIIGMAMLSYKPIDLNNYKYTIDGFKSSNNVLQEFSFNPTERYNNKSIWVSKEYNSVNSDIKGLNKLIIRATNSEFDLKGKTTIKNGEDHFREKYQSLGSNFLTTSKIDKGRSNNIYLYDDNKMAVFFTSEHKYFIFEFIFNESKILKINEMEQIADSVITFQEHIMIEHHNKWYVKYAYQLEGLNSLIKKDKSND